MNGDLEFSLSARENDGGFDSQAVEQPAFFAESADYELAVSSPDFLGEAVAGAEASSLYRTVFRAETKEAREKAGYAAAKSHWHPLRDSQGRQVWDGHGNRLGRYVRGADFYRWKREELAFFALADAQREQVARELQAKRGACAGRVVAALKSASPRSVAIKAALMRLLEQRKA